MYPSGHIPPLTQDVNLCCQDLGSTYTFLRAVWICHISVIQEQIFFMQNPFFVLAQQINTWIIRFFIFLFKFFPSILHKAHFAYSLTLLSELRLNAFISVFCPFWHVILNVESDDDDENSYKVLRRAVREHWTTMKEYYRAVRYLPLFSLMFLVNTKKVVCKGTCETCQDQ